jgi:hypothetical protein
MATDRSALSWTSAQVLSDVRRKASLPVTSTDWTDAVILREATDAIYSFAAWALAQAGEGRLLASLDRPVTANLSGAFAAGNEVMLPPLAVAGTLEQVTWVNAEGRIESRLARIDLADQPTYATPVGEGSPSAYAFAGDRIRLYPRPTTGGTLRLTYQRRHPELVSDVAANVGTLLSIAAATSTTTTLTESVGITGLVVGDTIDILRGSYPYAPIAVSAEVLSLPNATTLVVDQPLGLLSGHDTTYARIVRAGQSPYVALPLELRSALTEKTAANILRVMGDLQGMQASEQAATMELARVMQMLSPRSKRDKPKAVNPNSLMRTGMTRWRW